MDGLTALPLLLEKKRDLIVIMASTLTRRNAEVSLKALSLGAADYVPKPATNREVTTSGTFRRDLIERLGAMLRGVLTDPDGATPLPGLERRLIGAALALVSTHATDGDPQRLRDLEPELSELLLASL